MQYIIILIGSEESKLQFKMSCARFFGLTYDQRDPFRFIDGEFEDYVIFRKQCEHINTICVVCCEMDGELDILSSLLPYSGMSKQIYTYDSTDSVSYICTQISNLIRLYNVVDNEFIKRKKIIEKENKKLEKYYSNFNIEQNELDMKRMSYDLFQYPKIQQFGSDLSIKKSSVQLRLTQIEYMLRSVRDFMIHPEIIAAYEGEWKGFSRYFPKIHHPYAERSFLIFTTEKYKNNVFLLIKSNTKISEPRSRGDVLWYSGSAKQVKLYSLLIVFDIDDKNINISKIRRIVTFSKPSKEIVASALHSMVSGDPNSRPCCVPKHLRLQYKSESMRALVSHPDSAREFSNWHFCISFVDPVFNQRRVLMGQRFYGNSFETVILNPRNRWNEHQKYYFIETLLRHLLEIIECEKTWPSDIKFTNVCYKPSKKHVGYFEGKFIDYLYRESTYTIFNRPERNKPAEGITYTHPVALIQNFSTSAYTQACENLDQRNPGIHAESLEFKMILYQMFFELSLLFFWTANAQPINTNLFCTRWFLYNEKFSSELEFTQVMDAIKVIQSGPFYSLLYEYTYRQNFSHTTVQMIELFFKNIRQELIRVWPKSLDDYSENNILSDTWIAYITTQLTELPQFSPVLPPLNIEELRAI